MFTEHLHTPSAEWNAGQWGWGEGVEAAARVATVATHTPCSGTPGDTKSFRGHASQPGPEGQMEAPEKPRPVWTHVPSEEKRAGGCWGAWSGQRPGHVGPGVALGREPSVHLASPQQGAWFHPKEKV